MITLESKYGILTDRMVLYPNEAEIAALTEEQPFTSLVRIRHSKVDVPATHKSLVYHETMRTTCVDLSKSLDDIYKGMDPKSCRYEIRKAEKMLDNVRIRVNEEGIRDDFFRLYNDFVVKKGHARPLSDQRFRQYLSIGDVFVVYFNERPVCGHLLLPDLSVKRVRLLFSASSRLNSKEDAPVVSPLNRYLHWHEFQKYKADGFESYDFGGISLGGSIAKFKMSFGGELIEERGYVFAGGPTAWIIKASYKRLLWLLRQHAAFVTSLKRWQGSLGK